jgi:hypothetical protein
VSEQSGDGHAPVSADDLIRTWVKVYDFVKKAKKIHERTRRYTREELRRLNDAIRILKNLHAEMKYFVRHRMGETQEQAKSRVDTLYRKVQDAYAKVRHLDVTREPSVKP